MTSCNILYIKRLFVILPVGVHRAGGPGVLVEACVLARSPSLMARYPDWVQTHLSTCRKGRECWRGVTSVNRRERAPVSTCEWSNCRLSAQLLITSRGSDVYCGLNESSRFKAATCWDFVLPHVDRWMRDSGLSKLIRQGLYWSAPWEWRINNRIKQKIKSVIGENWQDLEKICFPASLLKLPRGMLRNKNWKLVLSSG